MKDLITHVSKKNLFDENETIVVALSGGIDSMVLFDILQQLPTRLHLVIAHVNHKMREESDTEFDNIKKMAKQLKQLVY